MMIDFEKKPTNGFQPVKYCCDFFFEKFQKEFPVPEQFKTTVSKQGLTTTAVESKG